MAENGVKGGDSALRVAGRIPTTIRVPSVTDTSTPPPRPERRPRSLCAVTTTEGLQVS